jgi:hypothetical protein
LLVSLVSFAEWLPWLLFGLLSGALLERWDRRRVMWTVDAARFAIVAGLAVAVLADQAGIALLAVVGFLLGTGQTLVDTGRGRRPPWSPSSTSWPRPAAP